MFEYFNSFPRLVISICENIWIRRTIGVNRVKKRRLKDLRLGIVTEVYLVSKIVTSRMINKATG